MSWNWIGRGSLRSLGRFMRKWGDSFREIFPLAHAWKDVRRHYSAPALLVAPGQGSSSNARIGVGHESGETNARHQSGLGSLNPARSPKAATAPGTGHAVQGLALVTAPLPPGPALSADRILDLIHDLDAIVWEAEIGDNELCFTFVNRTAETMFGYPLGKWLEQPGFWLSCVHPDDRDRLTGFYDKLAGQAALASDKIDRRLETEYRARAANGALFCLRDVAHFAGARNGVRRLRGVMLNVSQDRRLETLIAHLASHDALTDLPNRATLLDRLTRALTRARRHRHPVGVLLVGLDRFKPINDILGRGVGDDLLQDAAGRIAGCLREADTVARLDGDTFAVVAEDLARPQDVALVGRRVLESLAEPFSVPVGGKKLHLTASIGIGVYPGDGEDAHALLKHAEVAMHHARKEGGNRQRFFAPGMDARAKERFSLEGSLRRALAGKELVLLYQPRQDLSSGHIVAVEVLLGWNHPDRGQVPQAEFLPLLEETGLIVEAGEWMLRTAATQLRAWDEAGIPPLRLAVGISARQLRAGNLIEELIQQLADTGFDTARLELEVAQDAIMKPDDRIVRVLRRLDAMGIRLSVNDFGIAPISLEHLRRLPIHTVKIAPALLQNLPADEHSAALVRGIISMARGLGFATVAVGVEREAQQAFLRACGCDVMQGGLFCPPLKAEEFIMEVAAGDAGR